MKVSELSPAARAAVESKSITGGWDGKSLLKLLGELDRWDEVVEQKKSTGKKMLIGGIVGFVPSVILLGFEPITGCTGIALSIGCAIFGYRKRKSAQKVDLPNELRVTLRPVLKKLKQDLHPEEKIKVDLNLQTYNEDKPAKKREYQHPRGKFTESSYVEDLGQVRMPLTDGSTALVRIENAYIELKRSYRSTRGKYKIKTKWKKMTTVTAMLIPGERIPWQSGRATQLVDPQNERITFSEKNGVMAARLDRYYKFKAAGNAPENVPPAEDVMRMLIRLSALRPQTAGGAQ